MAARITTATCGAMRWGVLLAAGASPAGLSAAAPGPGEPPPSADRAIHRERAAEVMASIQDRYWDRRSGLYSAKAGGDEPEMIWGGGVMFSALVAACRHDPRYLPVMRRYFRALDAYWDVEAEVPGYEPARTRGGHDKYYDDNAWMVLTFLEAHEVTGEGAYRRRAEEAMRFVLSGWDEQAGGGIWWHEQHKEGGKNTCVNAPAALGAYRLARLERGGGADGWDRWGDRIMVWTVDRLQAPDGLFFDALKVASGEINRVKMSYNSGLMIRGFIALHARTGERYYLAEALRIARAAESLRSRSTGAYRDPPKWAHLLVEADLELHRWTGEAGLLERAATNAAVHYAAWRDRPAGELIEEASLARELWLLADLESPDGRAFWEKVDRGRAASPP